MSVWRRVLVLGAIIGFAIGAVPLAVGDPCGLKQNNDGCSGSCTGLQFCGLHWPDMTDCVCQNSDGSGGGCGGVVDLAPLPNLFSGQVTDTSGGPGPFAVGNSLTMSQDLAVPVEVHHSAAWGGGVQTVTVPANTLSVTVRLTGIDSANPNRRTAVIAAIGATLPSFASVALGGGQTGDNVFSIDPSRTGSGWIDTTTGQFHFQIYARLFNGIFQASPALLQTVIEGTFNPATLEGTVTSLLDGDFDVIAASPDTTLW